MPLNLKGIFSTGAKDLVESIGNAIDKNFTSKEEKAQAMLEVEKETNRHLEAIESNLTKQYELEVQDRSNARNREAEFVKATGHLDYLMWVLAIGGLALFAYMVYAAINGKFPDGNKELIFHIFGLVEGTILTSVYNYYFGSSAGSRIKDMKR